MEQRHEVLNEDVLFFYYHEKFLPIVAGSDNCDILNENYKITDDLVVIKTNKAFLCALVEELGVD